MANQWYYANSNNSQVGTMICTACNKPITYGLFRYRETNDAYLPQHKHCSLDDKEWQRLERQQIENELFMRRRKIAYDLFVAEFGVPDDLIEGES